MQERPSGDDRMSNGSPQGTFFLGRYRVVDEIGQGGMASVHLARVDGPGGFQKWVAIKRIHAHLTEDDQFVDMFLDEARIAASISHANVAQVFELGETDGTFWIAMEYLHGEPLREITRAVEDGWPRMPFEIAAKIIADAAEGLHAAHDLKGKQGQSLGLVHRDVTPHNLFVTYEGNTKVVDFGIAKVAGRLSSTKAGTLKGKLAYMSPEQVRGQEIDRRTDIFALGVVLWELTTGHRLFRMESDIDTLEKVQNCVVPPPSTIVDGYPGELEMVVMKALAKNREQRFQTARDLSRALQQYLVRRGVLVGPDEVATYLRSIFGERMRQRNAHLQWAAEVTQTLSVDEVRRTGRSSDSSGSLSLQSYDSAPVAAPRPAAGAPASAQFQPARPMNQPAMRVPGPNQRTAQMPAQQGYAPTPQYGAPQPPSTELAKTVAPGKRGGVAAVSVPSASPLPSFDESSHNSLPDLMDDDDDDENIATVIAPQKDLLPERLRNRGAASGPVAVAPSLTPVQAAPRGPAPVPYNAPPAAVPATMSMPSVAQPVPVSAQPAQAYAPAYAPAPVVQQPIPYTPPPMATPGLEVTSAGQKRPAGGSGKYIAIGLGGLFLVAVIGVGAFVMKNNSSSDATPAASQSRPVSTQVSTVTSVPTSLPTATAAPSGSAPPSISLNDLTNVGPGATARPTSGNTGGSPAPTPTPTATEEKKPAGEGKLSVVCVPACDSVSAGSRGLGPSPVVVSLPAGSYTLSLRRKGAATKAVPVTINPGQTTPVKVSME